MSNVINLFHKRIDKQIAALNTPSEQTASGEAFCLGCKFTWIAVAPTGTTQLECPACKALKGHWKFEFNVPEGSLVRVCNCGNDLFRLTPEGHMCANCGLYHRY